MRALPLALAALAGCAPPPSAPAPGLGSRAEAALRAGAGFLLRTQNPDGSWGSHDPVALNSSAMGFGLTPGPQDAVRNAVTALCAQALMRSPEKGEPEERAAGKAVAYLLDHWQTGYEKGASFHCWGYAYTLDLLVECLGRPEGEAFRERIRQAVPGLISGLAAQQRHEGGWTYYGGPGAQGSTMSFTTATVLLALVRAARAGFPLPPGLAGDAVKAMAAMRFPDGRFNYGLYLRNDPGVPLQPLGAGARTQACLLALHEAGHGEGPDALRRGLRGFLETADYLELGRKRVIPHRDAPHMISGYFFFYGYHYAAETLPRLPRAERAGPAEAIAQAMLRTQEANGSWWDTLCYDYGDKWGTAFAMMALARFMESL